MAANGAFHDEAAHRGSPLVIQQDDRGFVFRFPWVVCRLGLGWPFWAGFSGPVGYKPGMPAPKVAVVRFDALYDLLNMIHNWLIGRCFWRIGRAGQVLV